MKLLARLRHEPEWHWHLCCDTGFTPLDNACLHNTIKDVHYLISIGGTLTISFDNFMLCFSSKDIESLISHHPHIAKHIPNCDTYLLRFSRYRCFDKIQLLSKYGCTYTISHIIDMTYKHGDDWEDSLKCVILMCNSIRDPENIPKLIKHLNTRCKMPFPIIDKILKKYK